MANSTIAADATQYQGHKYSFGGSPGTNGQGGWDCSSFVNWVLGHDLGYTLPGMHSPYTGSSHGPVVVSYVAWHTAKTVSKPSAGDLCIWPGIGSAGHIGIALSATTMISALNPSMGTAITPIKGYGPPGVPVMYRSIGVIAKKPGWFVVYSAPASGIKYGSDQYNIVSLKSAPKIGARGYSGIIEAILGPYKSERAAEAAIAAKGTTGQANPLASGRKANQPPPNPLAGIEAFVKEMQQIFGDLSSTEMWERIGLVVVGAIMFFVGLALAMLSSRNVRETTEMAAGTAIGQPEIGAAVASADRGVSQ